MASIHPDEQSTYTGRPSLLDEWRAEVGDEEIARIVAQARREAEDGSAPSFTDRDSLLAHWRKLADGA